MRALLVCSQRQVRGVLDFDRDDAPVANGEAVYAQVGLRRVPPPVAEQLNREHDVVVIAVLPVPATATRSAHNGSSPCCRRCRVQVTCLGMWKSGYQEHEVPS